VHFEETPPLTSKMCIFSQFAHILSFYAHPYLNGAYRISVNFVSQKNYRTSFRRRLSAGAQGRMPPPVPPPTRRHWAKSKPVEADCESVYTS